MLIVTVAIALGGGWIVSGMLILRRSGLSWLPLVCALIITYVSVVRGFVLYQDIRASKTLVNTVDSALSVNTLWTFEGSREIGAAGAISYYLNQDKNYSLEDIDHNNLKNDCYRYISPSSRPAPSSTICSQLKSKGYNYPAPGWARGKHNIIYRTVMVLSDGGKNRLPPQFPGNPPQYLITQQQLQTYWDSDLPVVFVTDFLRQPNDKHDPPDLNLPQGATQPQLTISTRKLYLNPVAQKLYQK